MSRQKTTPEQTLIAFFTTAPLEDAERLLQTAKTIVGARTLLQTPVTQRKKRADAGKPRNGQQALEATQ